MPMTMTSEPLSLSSGKQPRTNNVTRIQLQGILPHWVQEHKMAAPASPLSPHLASGRFPYKPPRGNSLVSGRRP
jgi:hypothetical protein